MHTNNLHKNGYDFDALIEVLPSLAAHTLINKYGKLTINFSDPLAVKLFNQALLIRHYGIEKWDIPEGYLCPPVPSRVDYLHHLSDRIDTEAKAIKIIDIGVGANCIYPLLGAKLFAWNFVGTEVNKQALKFGNALIAINQLEKQITIRHQKNDKHILKGIIKKNDYFEALICNPPFYESAEQANLANIKKWKKLGYHEKKNLNFGGQSSELWCEGGAIQFISKIILESIDYQEHIKLFSVLVSKKAYLKPLIALLDKSKASHDIIEMEHGHKKTRILTWRF